MTGHPLRLWRKRAFGRSPLLRGADRIEAWALVAAFVLLVVAVFPSLAIGHLGYTARTQEIAAIAASRHSVQATALGDSVADPSVSESAPSTFTVDVQYFVDNATRQGAARVDKPVKSHERLQIWVNDDGNVTTAPLNAADARVTELGTVALSWLVLAVAVGGAFALLRVNLNHVRNRRWDSGWRALVENGGGSSTVTP